jgi:uncharacterized membrane protein
MLIAWFACAGLPLGIVSLRLMQEILTRAAGHVAGWVLVAVVTVLGSIGIYLVRFLGWNSWNVFQAPLAAFGHAFDRGNPNAGVRMAGFTVLFARPFLFVYVTVYLLGDRGKRCEPMGPSDTRAAFAVVATRIRSRVLRNAY